MSEIPEHLLRRSAEAKAKALGVPVEQVIAEMKGEVSPAPAASETPAASTAGGDAEASVEPLPGEAAPAESAPAESPAAESTAAESTAAPAVAVAEAAPQRQCPQSQCPLQTAAELQPRFRPGRSPTRKRSPKACVLSAC